MLLMFISTFPPSQRCAGGFSYLCAKQMTIYLLPDVAEKLKAIAKARKKAVGAVIEEMVDKI